MLAFCLLVERIELCAFVFQQTPESIDIEILAGIGAPHLIDDELRSLRVFGLSRADESARRVASTTASPLILVPALRAFSIQVSSAVSWF